VACALLAIQGRAPALLWEMDMAHTPRAALLAAVAILALAGGCRENEQNRPLDFQPHVYQGQKPPSLSEQQKRDLQERGNMQR
jgi:hypothetical protein